MLTIDHVSKSFGELTALKDVSFTVEPGQILGLIGKNGAGKSTLFHSILNLFEYQGKITWENEPITPQVFDQIGYLPEERSLLPNLTIERQISYLAKLKDFNANSKLIDEWLQRFEVKGDRKTKIKSLSKGNQQKVQLICTLIHHPKLIILDEPFSGLDPVNAELLKQAILKSKQDGAAIIFSSHNMANVEEVCDRLVMLNLGETVLNGSVSDVRNQFGKINLFVTTNWTKGQLNQLPGASHVQELSKQHYLLKLTDPAAGKEIFNQLTQGKYIEQFSQQPLSLDEIFRMKAGNTNE
ncbi:ATP-binding cassette domain-containing protein [Lactobacillus sp. ESL0791]|uniref:ABC transporter ATP-binding protein n=1 Tax=Lactobacillus sp. ESL0791 TaxID=2983234 RepID=UPI0023F724CA|nr:ATP-binding cassette domain-containing protein [Lactobacillus sp. ESL0791]MDF7639611.1 ATP-binding cassette domain-containing protein [Lactobacillus sp. ESL0791]